MAFSANIPEGFIVQITHTTRNIIIEAAKSNCVCLLTGGDPMTATTHVGIRLQAIEKGIETKAEIIKIKKKGSQIQTLVLKACY